MIFVKGLTHQTLALDVDLNETVANVRCALQAMVPVRPSFWRIVYAGRQLSDEKTLRQHHVGPDSTLHVVGRLLGGKGGFGSLLRGAGRAILTDNVDACRDLSGRRLRQANAEKRLAEWAAEARERELEKVALKHVKEQQKATQKEERAQVDSEAVRREQQEALDRVSAAVVAAQEILNGGTLETGKRKAGLSDIQKPAKRARIYGFEDLSSSDSDNDSEYEAAARLSKAGHMAAASSSGDDSELSAQETALADAEAPSTSAAAARSAQAGPSLNAQDDRPSHSATAPMRQSQQEGPSLNAQGNRPSHSATAHMGQSGKAVAALNPQDNISSHHATAHTGHVAAAAHDVDKPGQQLHQSSSVKPAADATPASLPSHEQSPAKGMLQRVDLAAAEARIDLADFSDAKQLESVGLDRLKAELQRHGLKCGGNLKDRAVRMFLLKSTPLDKLDQQHFSKPAKKK